MNIVKKINTKNISLALCFLVISAYIILGNCLTFNLGNRLPIKTAEIIAAISCLILLIIHKKDLIKISKDNIKILIWFAIAAIPVIFFDYSLKQSAYGLLYSLRIIATLCVAIAITNVFKKYEISRDKICNYIIYNYLIVVGIGLIQLIFFPVAYDFYDIFYNMGVYFANPDPHVGRLISTYFDPNYLAACLIIPSMLCLNYYAKKGSKLNLLYLVIFITAIVLTVSRSGVLGICIALFIYFISTIRIENKKIEKSKTTIRALAIGIIVATIFAFLTFCTDVRVFKRILGTANDDSTYARISDWSKGLQTISSDEEKAQKKEESEKIKSKNNLVIGIGYNMLGFTEANSSKASSASFGNDSSLLVILITSGTIGSLYFIYVITERLIRAYKERKKYTDNEALIAIIITSLVICNFNNLLFYTLWLLPIFTLLNLKKEKDLNYQEPIFIKKEKYKIGIDGRPLTEKRAGIGNYTYEIIKNLNEIDKENEYYIYSNKEIVLDFELNNNFHKCSSKFKIGTIWLYFILPLKLKKDQIDIFWGTQHCLPKRTDYTKKMKYILTIHDLAIFKFKKIGSFYNTIIQKIIVKKACNNADKIIAISNATKKDIVDICNIPEEKIEVIYNGTNYTEQYGIAEKEEKNILKELEIDNKEYILFLGTIEPRKNVDTIIKAFEILKEKNKKLILVIAGGLGWRYKKTLELIEKSTVKDDIKIIGYVDKTKKEVLYKNSKCFVYPSLYEGFGLPILEAMNGQTIVVTAKNSSLTEVGGECAIYCEEELDENKLAESISKALNMSLEERKNTITKSRELVKKFSWKKTSEAVLNTLKN